MKSASATNHHYEASFTLHGAGVFGGIAIGRAHLVSSARFEVGHYEIAEDDVADELRRFDTAIERVRGELADLHRSISPEAPAEMGAFLDLHLMILDDPNLSAVPRALIREKRYNAEWALIQQMEAISAQFDAIEDPYLRERKNDIEQVAERVLKALPGNARDTEPPQTLEHDLIVVAHDLSPADMILFKQHEFAGFVTDLGGVTSHTAIVARSLAIPAIVGLHNARAMIRENELLIIDGREGVLIVNPNEQILEEFRHRRDKIEAERFQLKSLRSIRATTLDGQQVMLQANIELPQDVEEARDAGAMGIGLFRSEFLFLNRTDLPGEDEQYESYRQVVIAMDGMPVTIRTLDLGADKVVDGGETPAPNPALGLRAIRYCLSEPLIFQAQLRALLRASNHGTIRVLIPMLAHAHEIDQTLAAIAHAKTTLDERGVPYDRSMQVGGMIEIPAAALSLGYFVRKLDFLSIGTNDLIQYTLAIDRSDDAVAHLYDPLHPAVLQLIAQTISAANKAGKAVAVCGEMAGDLSATRLLLGLGLREFSMHPAQLPAVKREVLRAELTSIKAMTSRIMRAHDPRRRKRLLDKLRS
ncbi:MAG: phosphoenolpyruvate--protein phosphotransferase [Betaproteobacteria bacterium]|nr:phosphoenolpyruvate--protein phosphotransferase [Betaproteobacteria bacterium]